MKLSSRTLNIIFSIAFLLLISAFVYSYLNIQGLRSATQWVNHTNKVILSLENIYSDIKKSESGVRGYVITKDAAHLEEQHTSYRDVKQQLAFLDSLVSDNQEQKEYVDTLHVIVQKRFYLFNALTNLINNDADQTEVLALMKDGKATTDHISTIMQQMKQNEEVLLVMRNEKAEKLDKTTPVTIVLSGVLGFVVLAVSYFFISRDLKERKKIVQELKNKNTLLQYAQQVTQMGTFQYTVETNELIWSDEMFNIFEIPKDRKPEIGLIDTLIQEDPKVTRSRRERIFKANENYSHEFKIRSLQGTEKVLLSNGYVTVDEDEKVRIVNGAIIDITALKKAELAALEQQELMRIAKERAENASQFKTRFLSNMTHEIRTPINAILGFSAILSKESISEKQRELLKHISVSGELLLKLIGNILDISKIEEGKVAIDNKSFHLKESIRSVLSPFKYTATEKGLTFNLAIDENIPDYVMGDSARISQALVNLVGNALKFTAHGDISVLVRLYEMRNETYYIDFSVTDTGIGIQKNKQQDVFESFTQANDFISIKYGGSGLGLSIVKEIVHLMGGAIQIESPVYYNERAKGYGSKFYFTLPFKIGEHISDQKSKNVVIAPFPEQVYILVAEDNEMNQKLAAYTLTSLGCTYKIVSNGVDAIEEATEQKYDIILMDMQMPVCDGIQATKQIRINNVRTPIVGLTANIFQEDIDACMDAGMNAHMGKPYTEEQLYSMIDKWVFNNAESVVVQMTDFSFLEKLSKNNSVIYREMLDVFLKQNNELVSGIHDARNNQDVSALSFLLHQYKSCVRILDIKKQISLISLLEEHIRNEKPINEWTSDLEKVIRHGKTIEKEIKNELLSLKD